MLVVLVAVAATALSVRVALASWPTDSEGSRLPRNYLAPARQAALLEYPVICLALGLFVALPTLMSDGAPTAVVACLAAMCLGGILIMQAGTMHRLKSHR